MRLTVKFRWDAEQAADAVAVLLSHLRDEALALGIPAGHAYFDSVILGGKGGPTGTLAELPVAGGEVDRKFRDGSVASLRGAFGAKAPSSFEFNLSRSAPALAAGSLSWRVPDEIAASKPGLGENTTKMLETLCRTVDVCFGNCFGLGRDRFSSYGQIANPDAWSGMADDVLRDHDWIVVIPPNAARKLDLGMLSMAASEGELRRVPWPDGRDGFVARVADHPSDVSPDQWTAWRDALRPALVEHQRVPRQRSDERPVHIAPEDWLVTGTAWVDHRVPGLEPWEAAANTPSQSKGPDISSLVFPTEMPSIAESAERIRDLMSEEHAPYGGCRESITADPAAIRDFQTHALGRVLPTEPTEFLTADLPIPWGAAELHYTSPFGETIYGLISLYSDGARNYVDLLVPEQPQQTAPLVAWTHGDAFALVFPSLRSALWLWSVCLERGLGVFDRHDHPGWTALEFVWWFSRDVLNARGSELMPEAVWAVHEAAKQHLIDVETEAGCLDDPELGPMIAEGVRRSYWSGPAELS